MVDEATIQKLEQILDEKMRALENGERRKQKSDE